jgi:16S rRNA C1402 (ribose-2'-O) methylase RsmI
VGGAIKHFTAPRGEFTLVIEGKGTKEKPQLTDEVEKQLHQMYLTGASAKEAIAAVAGETGLKRKELYQTWLRLDKVWERGKNTRKIK